MSVSAPPETPRSSPPPEKPKGRRRAGLAAIGVLAASAVTASVIAAVAPAGAVQPVGVGSVPINFDITDENGGWFDSGLNLFGSKSLAVAEMPRAGAPLAVPAIGGPLIEDPLSGLIDPLTKSMLGDTGLGYPGLGLDKTLETVRAIGASKTEAKGLSLKAEDLLKQLAKTIAAGPADQAVDVLKLPVGVELQGVLGSLAEFAVDGPPVTVTFNVDPAKSGGIRNPIGLIAPEGAAGYPWMDAKGAFYGKKTIQLTKPGLYAFTDSVAPYMLGAVVVDDPLTLGVDFGPKLMVNGQDKPVASNSDLIQRLVSAFFTITNPNNWQEYSDTKDVSWNPFQPPAPILQYDPAGNPVLIPNLDAYYDQKFGFPKTLPKLTAPKAPGVGEVWVATQMEDYAGKVKHGSITKVDTENWTVAQKIAAPEINMNNVHNMWTDKDYKYLYGNEWFSNKTDVFDRATGKWIRSLVVGPNPAHVMTRPGNDDLTIGINAGVDIVEALPGATGIVQRIPVNPDAKVSPHPHAHWTSADGKTVVAPETMTNSAVIADLDSGTVRHLPTGPFPIATSMTPDDKKAYLSDFLGGSITCVSLKEDACATPSGGVAQVSTIDLWQNYNPQTGPEAGKPWGGLTIQLPVSPDGKAMLAENTLSQTVSVIDPRTNKYIKDLPCNAGCHGGNFGAKKGGGYYAYISNKFSNAMQVIDFDPNNDGDISDATVAGQIVMGATPKTKVDDQIVAHPGQGGQGVVAIPLVYNGWVQQNPEAYREKLTAKQLNPIGGE